MTIHLYLNNSQETKITSFYDMVSNPFKVGDTISFTVDELFPADTSDYPEHQKKTTIDNNNLLQDSFNRKKLTIVKEGKFVRFNGIREPRLTIEYHCIFTDEE